MGRVREGVIPSPHLVGGLGSGGPPPKEAFNNVDLVDFF